MSLQPGSQFTGPLWLDVTRRQRLWQPIRTIEIVPV